MRRNLIATEIALTREEIVRSRETTSRLLAEMDQRNAEGREVTNKLLAEMTQQIAESREQTRQLFAEQDQRNEDMRLFMRDERTRANKVLEPLIVEINAQREEMRAQREEMTAQRKGFFELIDQLREGRWGGDPPA